VYLEQCLDDHSCRSSTAENKPKQKQQKKQANKQTICVATNGLPTHPLGTRARFLFSFFSREKHLRPKKGRCSSKSLQFVACKCQKLIPLTEGFLEVPKRHKEETCRNGLFKRRSLTLCRLPPSR